MCHYRSLLVSIQAFNGALSRSILPIRTHNSRIVLAKFWQSSDRLGQRLSLFYQAKVPPVRNGDDNAHQVRESEERIDAAHERVAEALSFGCRIRQRVPVDLIAEKPQLRSD